LRAQAAGCRCCREAKGVVERWNEQIAVSRDMLWSRTIRAALIAATPWLEVFCLGIPTKKTTCSDEWRPSIPIDDDQGRGCMGAPLDRSAELSIRGSRQA
jgi:hypothetical protein